MAYDANKDVKIESWDNGKGLMASIDQYNEGEKKFQVGPRRVEKKNGDISYNKAGRLTYDEIVWLRGIIDEAVAILSADNSETN